MRPANTTAGVTATAAVKGARFHHLSSSPIPYLFGGLALMLGLIALALVILACSFRISGSGSPAAEEGGKPAKDEEKRQEMEPRFVVIMPGDDNPKFLAKPAATSDRHSDQV